MRRSKQGSEYRLRGSFGLAGIIALLIFSSGQAQSQQAQEGSAAPPVPSATYEAGANQVWEALIQIIQDHELPIANSDQSTGTVTTQTKRYFKILSAKFPPVQFDYRDTYTINMEASETSTKVRIQRKFETYDHNVRNWVESDPAKADAGVAVDTLFNDLRTRLETAGAPQG